MGSANLGNLLGMKTQKFIVITLWNEWHQGQNSIYVPRVQKCSCALHDIVNGSQSVSWSRLFHIKLDAWHKYMSYRIVPRCHTRNTQFSERDVSRTKHSLTQQVICTSLVVIISFRALSFNWANDWPIDIWICLFLKHLKNLYTNLFATAIT